jgi:uncharacterized peroxidase-related enzyme
MMPHIDVHNELPGILSLFEYRPETARPMSELAEVLLRGPSTLSRGERELIAAQVSALNTCQFCTSAHAAFAAAQLPEGMPLVEQVRVDVTAAPISAKLRALLEIAALVRQSGLAVRAEDIAVARAAGASDVEIHDAVLIAAAFCMFNRYVDGLATVTPEDPASYALHAERIVADGYLAAATVPDA